MIPDAQDRVSHIAQKKVVIVRIRTVHRVGQPKILPDDDAVPVTGFVKFVVSGLADPVANKIEIQITVVPYGNVILASAVAQISLWKTPVAAACPTKRRPLM
jgi:hypothetical protein